MGGRSDPGIRAPGISRMRLPSTSSMCPQAVVAYPTAMHASAQPIASSARSAFTGWMIDGRAPFSQIAQVLGVSDQTVARRLRRLRPRP